MFVPNRATYENPPQITFRVDDDAKEEPWDTADHLRRMATGFARKGDTTRARACDRAADALDPPSDAEPDAALVEARFSLERALCALRYVEAGSPITATIAAELAEAHIRRAMSALPNGEEN